MREGEWILPIYVRRLAAAPPVVSFAHVDLAPAEFFPVSAFNDGLGVSVFAFDETESSRTAGVTVGDDLHGLNRSELAKKSTELLFRGTPRQISNKKLLHSLNVSSLIRPARMSNESGQVTPQALLSRQGQVV